MAETYTLIASTTLASAAEPITFSSIPQTYTDLLLKISARTVSGNEYDSFGISFNGPSGGTSYSRTTLGGNGSSAFSQALSNWDQIRMDTFLNGNSGDGTPNTFTSIEIYVPDYTSSINKVAYIFGASEKNGLTAHIQTTAGLLRNTAAVSSITMVGGGWSFAIGSVFTLYGIKNS